jgi:FkbM family methyltransferase
MASQVDPLIGVPLTSPEQLVLEDYVAAIKWHYEVHPDPHEEDFCIFAAFSGPDELFLDVGAAIGLSVASIRKFAQKGRIVSFEPSPWLAPPLAWLKQKEGDQFEYHLVGAGSKSSVAELIIPCLNNAPNFYLASFVMNRFGPGQARIEGIRHLMGAKPTDTYSICRLTVQVKRIDEFHLHPTVVKIDAETFEFDVLKGMADTIQLSRPLVMIEGANRDLDVLNFFQSRAYKFAERRESRLQVIGTTSQATNGFYVAEERIAEYAARGVMLS